MRTLLSAGGRARATALTTPVGRYALDPSRSGARARTGGERPAGTAAPRGHRNAASISATCPSTRSSAPGDGQGLLGAARLVVRKLLVDEHHLALLVDGQVGDPGVAHEEQLDEDAIGVPCRGAPVQLHPAPVLDRRPDVVVAHPDRQVGNGGPEPPGEPVGPLLDQPRDRLPHLVTGSVSQRAARRA